MKMKSQRSLEGTLMTVTFLQTSLSITTLNDNNQIKPSLINFEEQKHQIEVSFIIPWRIYSSDELRNLIIHIV